MRRAQATAFAIAGIIILVLLSGLFALRAHVQGGTIEGQIDAVLADFALSTVQTHIESCLRLAAEDRLRKAGLQGGFVFAPTEAAVPGHPPRAGMDYLPLSMGAEHLETAYGIRESRLASNPSDANTYPAPGEDFDSYTYTYFGTPTLPKLCDRHGPNREDFGGPGRHDTQTCLPGTYTVFDGEPNIQADLGDAIAEDLAACLGADTAFSSRQGQLIVEGAPRANVTWGDDAVTVEADYPARITLSAGRSTTHRLTFSVRLNARFKALYNFAYVLIQRETRDIRFDVATDWARVPTDLRGLVVLLHPDVVEADTNCPECPGADDNLVYLQDSASDLGGQPLIFQFAIQNRRPDLNRIPPPPPTVAAGPYAIRLEARDPDDEPLAFEATSPTLALAVPGGNGDYPVTLSAGTHQITLRVRDEPGRPWSLDDFQTLTFVVT